MAKKTINLGTSDSNYTIEKSGTRYLLAEDDVFLYADIVTDTGAVINNIELAIDGTVTGTSNPIEIGSMTSKNNAVIVSKTGIVDATDLAISMVGQNSLLSNKGTVLSTEHASSIGLSSVGDDGRIINGGFLKAYTGIIVDGDGNSVVNSGEISTHMAGTAVQFITNAGEFNTFINKGFIESGDGVQGSAGNEKVVNRGYFSGDIDLFGGDDVLIASRRVGSDVTLGAGNDRAIIRGKGDFIDLYGQAGDDTFDLRGANAIDSGTTIDGGADDDVYIVSRSDLLLDEAVAGGTDTVKSSVDFTLADDFENLVLTGKNAIDGSGNAAANVITGNAGSNRIIGLGGMDTLDGGAGNDTLQGGTNNDSFVFRAGSGKDIVTDFTDAADLINLSFYEGIDDFGDLAGKIKQKGADTVITLLDGDKITLGNFTATNLTVADFDF